MTDSPEKPLTSHDVPQANRVERVLDLALAVLHSTELRAAALGLHERDLRYYAHAAVVLGLLDRDGQPTLATESLAALPADRHTPRLALAFAESRVGRRWVAWAGVGHLGELDPGSAEAFLREASSLAASTAQRRATALHAWQRSLGAHVPEPFRLAMPSHTSAPKPVEGEPMLELFPELQPIPDLPEPGQRLFRQVARDLSPGELPALREEVQRHLHAFHVAARSNELLPVDIAEDLSAALLRLLDDAPSMSSEHRALAVGAARYFVSDDDASPDLESVLGLDDDVVVFNWVARHLGRDDLILDL